MKKTFLITILIVVLAACARPVSIPATLPLATTTPTATVATTTAPTKTALPTETPVLTPVVGVAGEPSIGDPYMPELGNTGYDVQRYTLRLALDPAMHEVGGQVQIEAVSTLDDLIEMSLDFTGFDVQSVTLDGMTSRYSRASNKLIVDFPAPIAQNTAFTLDVAYQGAPVFEPSPYVPFVPSLGLQYPPADQPDGSLFIVSEPDGAHYVFPCNDHPRDKATYRIELVVPQGLVGAANGKLVDTQIGVANAFPDGRLGDVYVWEENYPMASYLMTAAVGPYERLDASSPKGTPLRSYVFQDWKPVFASKQPAIGSALDWMGDLFGPYPFDEFGYAQVQLQGTSLETQTIVLLDVMSTEGTMVHEMSHMWFGDWVSLDSWQDIWRNEGLATYISWMWMTRDNPAALEEQVKQAQMMYESGPPSGSLNNPEPGQMFGMNSYYRGALLAHSLRLAMGDEAFFRGLKTYLQTYGGRTASFEEFKTVMEAAAGKPLEGVFEAYFK